jgi:hypothetical protein
MSGEDQHDLTGEWSGIYNYPALYPPNNFEASIRDSGGIITGVIRQPGEFFEQAGIRQHAVIEGSRERNLVRWVKVYDDLGRATPHYQGTVHPDGNEIDGTWHIPGDWSGTFLMVRHRQEKATEAQKVAEKIGAR